MNNLLINIALAGRGIVGSLICIVAAIILGRRFLQLLKVDGAPLVILIVSAVTGIIFLSATATLITFTGLAYEIVFLAVAILAVFLCHASIITIREEIRKLSWDWLKNEPAGYFILIALFLWLYILLCSIVAPYCTDSLAYHLIIPRNILADHTFFYNYFSYQAGLSYGWHFWGIFANIVGGARGFNCLGAWAALGLLCLIFSVVSHQYSVRHGAVAVLLSSLFLLLGISENDRTGIDVPLILLEGTALAVAAGTVHCNNKSRCFLVGLICGFAMATKLTAAGGVLVIVAVLFYYLERANRLKGIMITAAVIFVMGAFWPLLTYLYSGSPLPQLLLTMRTQGSPLPQLLETITHDTMIYKQYFYTNLAKSAELKVVALWLFSGFLLLLIAENKNVFNNKLVVVLGIFAVGHWLFMGAVSSLSLFHPRYNLSSLIAIGIISAIGWAEFLKKKKIAGNIIAVIVVMIFFKLWSPVPLVYGTYNHLRDFFEPVGPRTSHVSSFKWISKNLPNNAIIAGPAIETYYAQRKYLQMQGISQEKIDLSQSPVALLAELKNIGVTHIHITNEYDLPQWSVVMAKKWLSNFDQISALAGIELVYKDPAPYYDHMSDQTVVEKVFRIQ
jgi:hypothetical protein